MNDDFLDLVFFVLVAIAAGMFIGMFAATRQWKHINIGNSYIYQNIDYKIVDIQYEKLEKSYNYDDYSKIILICRKEEK